MALIVKPVAVAAPQGVMTSRPASSARGGTPASMSGPVDASSPVGGSLFGDGSFSAVVTQDSSGFSGQSFTPGRRGDHENDLPNPQTGIVEFTSQGFAELLELRDTILAGSLEAEGKHRGKATGRSIEYASALYEAVIDFATGNRNLRGETISINL